MIKNHGVSFEQAKTVFNDPIQLSKLDHNYDFSNAIRGRFYSSKKVSTTLQLDSDLLFYLKNQANEKHIRLLEINNLPILHRVFVSSCHS